jgi:hypothetical protein
MRCNLQFVSSFAFLLFCEERGFFPVIRGPLWLSSRVPRNPAVVSVRNPQRLMLADGTFFPPSCCAIPWERASAPGGVAPKALQERGRSFKVFSSVCQFARCQFQPASAMFQPASTVLCARIDIRLRSVHIQEV